MKRLPGVWLVVLAMAALLASLTLVTWRQSRALEALAELDHARSEVSIARAERDELTQRIQGLESRARVISEATRRLGMRTPEASEIVYVAGAAP